MHWFTIETISLFTTCNASPHDVASTGSRFRPKRRSRDAGQTSTSHYAALSVVDFLKFCLANRKARLYISISLVFILIFGNASRPRTFEFKKVSTGIVWHRPRPFGLREREAL